MSYSATGSMNLVLIYVFVVTTIPFLVLWKYLDIDEGRKQCRSMKTSIWVKNLRTAKGMSGKRKKKKKKHKKNKVRAEEGESVTSSSVTSSTSSSVASSAVGVSGLVPESRRSSGGSSVASSTSEEDSAALDSAALRAGMAVVGHN